jgi:hypothetical protein
MEVIMNTHPTPTFTAQQLASQYQEMVRQAQSLSAHLAEKLGQIDHTILELESARIDDAIVDAVGEINEFLTLLRAEGGAATAPAETAAAPVVAATANGDKKAATKRPQPETAVAATDEPALDASLTPVETAVAPMDEATEVAGKAAKARKKTRQSKAETAVVTADQDVPDANPPRTETAGDNDPPITDWLATEEADAGNQAARKLPDWLSDEGSQEANKAADAAGSDEEWAFADGDDDGDDWLAAFG